MGLTLLDTNTIIHYLKGDPGVVGHIQAASRHELAVPCVVVYELEYGGIRAGARRRRLVSQVLAHLEHVPFDSEAAVAAAAIRVELESRGLTIGPLDLMIAGTALSRNATLVTNNSGEFSRVRGLRLLDWRSPRIDESS